MPESTDMTPLNLAFIGGGLNSAVGYTHWVASQLDGLFSVVAGCFSRDSGLNSATGTKFGIDSSRLYSDLDQLLSSEHGAVDAICVLTPTPNHAATVIRALDAGFDVICEKALATSISELEQVQSALSNASSQKLLVTFNYVGYPMVREARAMIRQGKIGQIQQVLCEMPQDSFSLGTVSPQNWRQQDYEIPCVSLDLGVHVHHLVDYLADDLELTTLHSIESTYGNIRGVIDTVHALARSTQGQTVSMLWGKAALGYANGLNFKVHGDRGSLKWSQTVPDILSFSDANGENISLERGRADLLEANELRYSRFKAGHPTGFIEAFSNIYADFYAILKSRTGGAASIFGIEAAGKGLNFLHSTHAASG